MPSAAYVDLARFLTARRRKDLLLPMASARAGMARAGRLAEVARRHADAAAATRLRAEALKQQAQFEHALHRVVDAIGDEPDGTDLVAGLMGGDHDRLLADRLLDGE
jgi:hypothetical protein